ncbi:hypothetical protein P7K49_009400, partial [Saguinus oedipus]
MELSPQPQGSGFPQPLPQSESSNTPDLFASPAPAKPGATRGLPGLPEPRGRNQPSLYRRSGHHPGATSPLPGAHSPGSPSRRGASAPGFVCAHRARLLGARDAPLPHTAWGSGRPSTHGAQPGPRSPGAGIATTPARTTAFPRRSQGGAAPTAPASQPERPAPPPERLSAALAAPTPGRPSPRGPLQAPHPLAAAAAPACAGGRLRTRARGRRAGAPYLSLLSRGSKSAASGAPASASSVSPPPPAAWLPPPAAAGTVGARASRRGLCGAPLRLASPTHPAPARPSAPPLGGDAPSSSPDPPRQEPGSWRPLKPETARSLPRKPGPRAPIGPSPRPSLARSPTRSGPTAGQAPARSMGRQRFRILEGRGRPGE